MESFDTLRQQISTKNRDIVERKYFTVTGEKLDERTINVLISMGKEMFLQKVIQEQGRESVLDTIPEIQERHDVANEMEKSYNRCHGGHIKCTTLLM